MSPGARGLPAAEALPGRADSGGCSQAALPAAEGPSGQRVAPCTPGGDPGLQFLSFTDGLV